MDRIKSYLGKSAQQVFINDVYKRYEIKLELSDADSYYLVLNDTVGSKTSLTLQTIHKYYQGVLDYRNADAVTIVRNVIRIRALSPRDRDMRSTLHGARHVWSSSDCHRFITSVGNVTDDEAITNIMYIMEDRFRFNDIMYTVETCDSRNLRTRFAHLRSTQQAVTLSSLLNPSIPGYLYKANDAYLSACNDMAGFIPKSEIFGIDIGDLMLARDYSTKVIQARTTLLRSLYESNLLSESNAKRLFPRYHKLSDSRSKTCIVSGNVAYCLVIYLNSYRMLTPSVLYSVLDIISMSHEGEEVPGPESTIGNKVPHGTLRPILKELESSDLYLSHSDWARLVSLS